MPSLHELQHTVMAANVSGDAECAAPLLWGKGITPESRIGIYANNCRVNFIETLQRTFPAIHRLVGDDYFRQCARAYQRLFFSSSGDLQNVGCQFSQYLSVLHAGTRFQYLADVARVEWAYQEALIAADHPSLDLERLRRWSPDEYEYLQVALHPSVRLVDSPYPVLQIWQENCVSSNAASSIDLDSGANRVLLARYQLQVKLWALDTGDAVFLRALGAGRTLGAAVVEAQEAAENFPAGDSLRKWIGSCVIVDFQPEGLR